MRVEEREEKREGEGGERGGKEVGKFEFFNLKIILEINLTKIKKYFLSYNNL